MIVCILLYVPVRIVPIFFPMCSYVLLCDPMYVLLYAPTFIPMCSYVLLCVYSCVCTASQNEAAVEIYAELEHLYNRLENVNTSKLRPVIVWNEEDVQDIVEARCRTNPPTFRNIAQSLNRKHALRGIPLARDITARDCLNQWGKRFPHVEDTNKTVQWVRELQKRWPGMYFQPETESPNDLSTPPKLLALHLVFPWSKVLMKTLAPSIFCDGTFNVTVFHYSIVMISTLDGNKQHRPLMCSFITRSTANQWANVFDIFKVR